MVLKSRELEKFYEKSRKRTGLARRCFASRWLVTSSMRNLARAPTSPSTWAVDTPPPNARVSWSFAATFSSKSIYPTCQLPDFVMRTHFHLRYARLLLFLFQHCLVPTLVLFPAIHRIRGTRRSRTRRGRGWSIVCAPFIHSQLEYMDRIMCRANR